MLRYGRIDEEVKSISADTDRSDSGEQYYQVDVSLDALYTKMTAQVTLLGMVASITYYLAKNGARLYLATDSATKDRALRD